MPHIRSVALGVWIDAGSSDELDGEQGIAHFIEHMLFKGTINRSARTIAEEFDGIGGDINAFTSKEVTCYFATVLNNHVEKALAIIADMFFNSQFDEVEMGREKSVILEEIATVEDTPDDDVHEQLWALMYANQPIGKPVLGTEETITTFDKKAIKKFMNRMYRPENIVISVAGNYDDSLIQLVENYFGSFQEGSEKDEVDSLTIPEFHAGFTLKEKDIEQTHICIAFPGLMTNDKRMYDLVILDSILGGSMSSRLFQEVREERGLAYSIYSTFSSHSNCGAFVIYGGTSPEKTLDLYHTIDTEIKVLLAEGVTEKEISNAKEQVKGSFLLGLEDSESRMSRNGNNELLLRSHPTVDEVVARIDGVKKQGLLDIAELIFNGKKSISIISPKGILKDTDFNT